MSAGLPEDEAQQRTLAARAGGSVREALLLTQFGGLEISDAVRQVVNATQFDIGEAWRIAEAVSGRDSAVQFGIFNQAALDMLSTFARGAASAGDLDSAARLSSAWLDAAQAIADADVYNLDKKQHVMDLLRRIHDMKKR